MHVLEAECFEGVDSEVHLIKVSALKLSHVRPSVYQSLATFPYDGTVFRGEAEPEIKGPRDAIFTG